MTVDAHGMASGRDGAGQQVVAEIMKYTGLPQNFDVLPHPQVPNAAAVILVGDDKLPHRVIAYNEKFMADVQKATANNNWAPISIMAHEVGHHLSGHTIQPGGSQPPTELEADKFSGYVLYKMGALLADAQKAMNTLVPEADGATHPGRSKRVRAIQEGWYLLLPLLALVYLLFAGYTPLFAGTVGLALTAVLILGSGVAREIGPIALRVALWIVLGLAAATFLRFGIRLTS